MPVMLRPWIYGLYASTFGVNLFEAESSDLKDYPSLADFFARYVHKSYCGWITK